MDLLFLCTAVTLLVLYTYNRIKHRRLFALGDKIPGPISYPIVGNLFALLNRKPEDVIDSFKKITATYGSLIRYWLGNDLALVVTDPKISEVILSSSINNLPKNRIYDFLRPWLNDGLLISKGKKWHNRRKIITPAFHFKILEQFVEIFDKQSQILVEKMKIYENGQVFDVYPFISLMALDVVCETAMGTQIHAQTDTQSKYVKAVHVMTRVMAGRFSTIWQRNEFLFSVFAYKMKRKQTAALKILHDFTKGIIKSRREQLLKDNSINKKEPDNDYGGNKKMAFLDILLKSTVEGISLSDNDIREEVDTFMFEGHDTTTSGMCFALYLLSRHKHIQDKLFEEIKDVLGSDKNAPVTYRNLQDLKYMELVIKETLRMFPSVPVIGRKLDVDTPIGNNILLPANSNVSIVFFVMFRNPQIFKNPDEFDPERFLMENSVENINPFAYIPFSGGSRNCIGQKFAMLEMKSTISKVLRHYELLPEGPEPIPVFDIILRSTNGFQFGLKKRNY